MKVQNIKTLTHANRFCEGTINDFETGISTKAETMAALGEYTAHLMGLFWENAKARIKANPSLLLD